MKPMSTAMSNVPPSSGGSQRWATVSTRTVSVLAMPYKPRRACEFLARRHVKFKRRTRLRFRSCWARSLSYWHLFLFKIDDDLPIVAGKYSMRRFGSGQLEPKLFSHFESVSRASRAQSEPVSFLAVVENVVDEFVQTPSLRAARRGCAGKHLQRQSRLFRQQHAFIDRQLRHRLHHLIYPFADLAVAVFAQVSDHPTNMLEHGEAALIGGVVTADKDRQVAVGSADVGAAHRRVEHLDGAHAQGIGYFNGNLWRSAAQIDKDQAVLFRIGDAVFATSDFFNIVRLQRRQHNRGALANFLWRRRAARALAYDWL